MKNSNPLQHVIDYATKAHEGQTDKAGQPYIRHPLRVARRCSLFGDDIAKVALLHDVVEDTEKTLKQVVKDMELTKAEKKALDAITKRDKEEYTKYLSRVSNSKIAWLVKIYDLEDNMSDERMSQLPEDVQERLLKKYNFALKTLALGSWMKNE